MPDATFHYAGLDLGTMHTAIASSLGLRRVTPSIVGTPKDELARMLLGQNHLFGGDIEAHRQLLTLHRPFERGSLKFSTDDQQADGNRSQQIEFAKLLLHHAVSLLEIPDSTPLRIVLGVPAQASMRNKQTLLEILSELRRPVLLVSEPFALAFSRETPHDQALIIDIGAGTTDVCHYYGAFPDEGDQITVGYGGDHLDLELQTRIQEAFPEANVSLNSVRRLKERYGFVGATTEPVIVRLPVRNGAPRDFDLTELMEVGCRELADRVVSAIETVLAQIDPEHQATALQHMVLAGGGSCLRGLDRYIERALGHYGVINVTRIHDCVFAGAQGALDLAMRLPESVWKSVDTLDGNEKTKPRNAA